MSEKVLLIWEEVPDYLKMYEFEEGTELAELAIASAGKYINGDDLPEDHAIYRLNDLLQGLIPTWGRNVDDETKGILHGPYKLVVFCGFYM